LGHDIKKKVPEGCRGRLDPNSKQAANCQAKMQSLAEEIVPQITKLNSQIEQFCKLMKEAGACYSRGRIMEADPKKEQYVCQPLTCQRCYDALMSDVRHGLTIGPTLRISAHVFEATVKYDGCKKKVTGACPVEDNLVLFLTNANCDRHADETAARSCYAPFVGR
jgi:hypothetical protein